MKNHSIETILEKAKYEYDNHIHKLLGFYDLDNNVYITITSFIIEPKEKETDNIIYFIDDKNNLIENNNFNQISFSVILYIYSNIPDPRINFKSIEKEYFIKNTNNCKIGIRYNTLPYSYEESSLIPQKGGRIVFGNCDLNTPITINFIRIYSEPIISYIEEFIIDAVKEYAITVRTRIGTDVNTTTASILQGYDSSNPGNPITFIYNSPGVDCDNYIHRKFLDLRRSLIGRAMDPFNNKIIDLCGRPINYILSSDYKIEVIDEHIINHAFAHNGFDNIGNLTALKNFFTGTNNFLKSQFIHGYLHILDSINIYRNGEPIYNIDYNLLLTSRRIILNSRTVTPIQILCFERVLSRNQLNFLARNAGNNNFLLDRTTRSYLISNAAKPEKERQYYNNRHTSELSQIKVLKQSDILATNIIETDEPPEPYYLLEPIQGKKRSICKRIIKRFIDEIEPEANGNISINQVKLNNLIEKVYKVMGLLPGTRDYTMQDLIDCIRLLQYKN